MMGITGTVPTGKLCDKGNFRGRNLCTAERAKKGEKMTKPDRWSGLQGRKGESDPPGLQPPFFLPPVFAGVVPPPPPVLPPIVSRKVWLIFC